MKLPNAEKAVVEREKITEYLLNFTHRYGASKARFFAAFGFRAEEWWTFAEALREQGRNHDVKNVRETGFGPRYEVEGRSSRSMADAHECAPSGKWIAARLRHASSPLILRGNRMINEHDSVVLTQDLPDEELKAGDIGTVVHIHEGGSAYEVEFMTLAGETICVATLLASQVRPIARREIAHAREIAAA